MNSFNLRKPPMKMNLNKVFKRAVKGYKNIEKRRKEERESSFEGWQTADILKAAVASMQTGEIKAEKLIIEESEAAEEKRGVPLTEPTRLEKMKEPEMDLTGVNVIYTLIPSTTNVPFASANIKWSRAENSLIYYLIEPVLTAQENEILKNIKTNLIEKLDVDFTQLRKGEARDYLIKRFEESINLLAAELSEEKRKEFLYFIERDFIGLSKIEPLMRDSQIEDISCDGIGTPIFIYHRNPTIGSIKSNITFNTKEELDIFVNKLSQRCGKNISVARPLVGGTLPDGSRVQAMLGTDIARKGSNFTIRKFTERPLTPTNLIKLKTLDPKIAAFLWILIEYGRSILMAGGVATGKTTLLNALSLFIKPELRVISIEDTAELMLPHPHWVPSVARLPIVEVSKKKLGEVDLYDLLKESLRQRPDYLIVGEVRGRETYVLFQQIATGHSSMSTMHADSMERLIDRLTTPPISLPASLIEALDLIIFIVRIKHGPIYVRRIHNIFEIIGFDREKGFPIVNEIFRWNAFNDSYESANPSVILKKISKQYGITENYLQSEISRRMKVMNWMVDVDIEDYLDVAKIIKLYYLRPEDILENV